MLAGAELEDIEMLDQDTLRIHRLCTLLLGAQGFAELGAIAIQASGE